MGVFTLLRDFGGAATWTELQQKGVRRRDLDQAMQRGIVVRRARGTYAIFDVFAEATAARWRGMISHQSAAWWYDYGLVPPVETHITVARDRHIEAKPKGVRFHYGKGSREGLITSPLQTVIDCARARRISLPHALAIAEVALRDGLERADLVESATAAQGPGAARTA